MVLKDEKTIQRRLEMLRGEALVWGSPAHIQATTVTREELRGWIRALEWVLGKGGQRDLSMSAGSTTPPQH